MKPSILFVSLSIIAMLVISEGVSTVHAKTLTKDFGILNVTNENGSTICSFDVTVNIQTESNGDWICGKIYDVSWVLTLTYINQTMLNDFTITFWQYYPPAEPGIPPEYTPQFNNDAAILRPTLYSVANGSAPEIRRVTIGSVATLSNAFTIGNKPLGFQFDLEVDYDVTNNGEPAYYPVPGESIVNCGEWYQPTSLYINIVSQSPKDPQQITFNPQFTQGIYFAAAVIIIIIGVQAYMRKRGNLLCTDSC
ncbi:MAG TPA: hypothetical protein VK536_01535 [Candidatus Limnocylindrales bacterium]|nr:hypothetical protein [Candidatus Limnocylindrales bacterium]